MDLSSSRSRSRLFRPTTLSFFGGLNNERGGKAFALGTLASSNVSSQQTILWRERDYFVHLLQAHYHLITYMLLFTTGYCDMICGDILNAMVMMQGWKPPRNLQKIIPLKDFHLYPTSNLGEDRAYTWPASFVFVASYLTLWPREVFSWFFRSRRIIHCLLSSNSHDFICSQWQHQSTSQGRKSFPWPLPSCRYADIWKGSIEWT